MNRSASPWRLRLPATLLLGALALAAGFRRTPLSAAERTWLGTTSANWNGVAGFLIVPVSNDSLLFNAAGAAGAALNNNLTSSTFNLAGITFSPTASAYTISGNAFTLTGDVTNSNASVTQAFNNPIAVSGGDRTFSTTGNITLNGVLSGASNLVKTGTGTLTLSAADSFTGNLTINGGTVVATSTNGVDGGSAPLGSQVTAGRTITVNPGGTLSFTVNDVFGRGQAASDATIPAVVINGGTLSATRFNVLGNVTLNGGLLTQNPSDSGNFQGYQFRGTITVGGTAASTISTTAAPVRGNHLSANTTFNVGSTGAAGGDLIVSAPLINQSANFGSAAGGLTKTGAGTMLLTGANPFTGATAISGGTLTAGAANALQSTSSITVNTSGTLLLAGAGSRIGDAVPITLAGGTFNTGGLSETVGALTLASNSILDLASGASILNFANSRTIAWTGTLSIYNWSGALNIGGGTDRVLFGSDNTGLTAAQLNNIQFFSGTNTGALGTARILSSGEIVPVPEPGTVLAGALALGTLGWHVRRRLLQTRRPATATA